MKQERFEKVVEYENIDEDISAFMLILVLFGLLFGSGLTVICIGLILSNNWYIYGTILMVAGFLSLGIKKRKVYYRRIK